MPAVDTVAELKEKLSSTAKVLLNLEDADFKEFLLRWSDINRKTPAAIVVAGTEEDVVTAVKFAVDHGIPFVPKSGGHSLWSTIGTEGFILDLSQLLKTSVDKEVQTVTLQSGVLIKQANEAAWEAGLILPLGTANSAGVIPMAIGGGLSPISSIVGFTSDNIIAAKIVTAKGELIRVSTDSHPELLYAIRGAGQFFGVVTEITLKGHPTSILNTPDGTVWTGSLIFSSDKAEDVFKLIAGYAQDTKTPTNGICIISAPPPAGGMTCLIFIPIYFGTTEEAEAYYKPLLDLGPMMNMCKSMPWIRVNDAGDAFSTKGGFKRFSGTGISKVDPKTWMTVIKKFEELKAKRPDTGTSGYAVEWVVYNPEDAPARDETAFSHADIKVWAELLSWYTDAASHDDVFKTEKDILNLVTEGQAPEFNSSYQNWSREDPIEIRYRGPERLRKLKELKKIWDPTGVFTKQLL